MNISANASSVRPTWPPDTSMDASSLVLPTPTPANTTASASASNSVEDVDINAALTNEPPVSVNNAPVSAPDEPSLQQPSAATPSSTPLPPPPSPPNQVATPSPQPDPSRPAVPPPTPSVSPPPPRTPVSPTPPPAKQTPPPLPPPPSPPPPPPPHELPPPPTSKLSPSPPPPQPVILSPPPPPATVTPPSLYVPPSPPPPLHPNSSSAPSSSSPTPTIPTPASPSPSTPPPGRNQSTDSPSTSPSSGDSSPSSSTSHDSSSSVGNFHVAAAVGGSVAAVVALAFIALVLFITKKRKKRANSSSSEHTPPPNAMASKPDARASKPPGSLSPPGESPYGPLGYHPGMPESSVSKSWFTYEELKDITAGFSQENLLGQGGFGCVYKGRLPDGRTVAVKQLKVGGGQGEREFRAEVEIISRVHHRHLVSLVGYCISENNQLLVYEYVPNKTLEYHLHAKGLQVMEWSKRVKIAIGSARGLAYLHEDCHPRIIHRDIKSANILLDECFEAQVADFGLAKLTNDANTHVSTRVMGTFGYMAPEYASSGKLTDRSDVFSFGVVLLELITGRKPVDASQPLGEESLVEWARPVLVHTLETGDCEELADPRLENNFSKSEMMMMIEAAAACVRHKASKRPRMVQVVRALEHSTRDMTDLSNGVRYGESTVFNSRQYSEEIRRFQRAAFASGEFSSQDLVTSGEHERRISIFTTTGEDPINIP